jgi:hypothetical protein
MKNLPQLVVAAVTVCATLASPAFAQRDPFSPPPRPSVATDPQPIEPTSAAWPHPPMVSVEDDEHPQTLVGGRVTQGAFGGPSATFTRLRGEDALLVGARGGWLINHRLVLGGAGYGLANRVSVPKGTTPNDADYQLGFGYGGVWLEYVFQATPSSCSSPSPVWRSTSRSTCAWASLPATAPFPTSI